MLSPREVSRHTNHEPTDHTPCVLYCNNRRFFRTAEGKFGIGPADLKEVDIVCGFLGPIPLVVLQQLMPQSLDLLDGSSSSRKDTDTFQVEDDAYMPDFMHGEAFRGRSCESMKHFQLI